MGYRTVQHVPACRTYANAKWIHDTSKPIRGRDPEMRPLGQRRDVDSYRVAMNGDVVEFILYKTPVVSYHPDGLIQIRTDGWSSVSTHQFIFRVLGIQANGKDHNKTVLRFANDDIFIMGHGDVADLRINEQGRLEIQNKQKLYGYQVNRTAMNKVRAQYKEFRQYLKGVVSLRMQETEHIVNKGTQWERRYTTEEMAYSVKEAVDALGIHMAVPWSSVKGGEMEPYVNTTAWAWAFMLPCEIKRSYAISREDAQALAYKQMPAFMSLCTSNQPEGAKHDNFHKALMVMLTSGQGSILAREADLTNVRTCRDPKLMDIFDNVMKRHHRADYLEKKELAQGVLPNMVYRNWMEN